MARPKSEDKRKAILHAAVNVFARNGVWSTPTSAISREAGVAEGTLFTYFATKEILANELYLGIKRDLADNLLSAFPEEASLREQFHHIWKRYVGWGVAHPRELKVMTELRLSDKISPANKTAGAAPFLQLERSAKKGIRKKELRQVSFSFMAAMMGGMAEATMTFIAQQGKSRGNFSESGFELFWKGISNR